MKVTAMILPLLLALCVSMSGCVCGHEGTRDLDEEDPAEIAQSDEEAILTSVEAFGRQIHRVSANDPRSIEEHYEKYVSPDLLAEWLAEPSAAPSRLTSSPWPDRIEIASLHLVKENTVEVEGDIIEITSTQPEMATSRPITLVVTKVGEHRLIDEVSLGAYR